MSFKTISTQFSLVAKIKGVSPNCGEGAGKGRENGDENEEGEEGRVQQRERDFFFSSIFFRS